MPCSPSQQAQLVALHHILKNDVRYLHTCFSSKAASGKAEATLAVRIKLTPFSPPGIHDLSRLHCCAQLGVSQMAADSTATEPSIRVHECCIDLHGELEHANRTVEQLAEKCHSLERTVTEARSESERIHARIAAMEEENTQRESEWILLRKERDGLEGACEGTREALTTVRKDLEASTQLRLALERKHEMAEEELATLRAAVTRKEHEGVAQAEKLAVLEHNCEQLRARCDELDQQLFAQGEAYAELKQRFDAQHSALDLESRQRNILQQERDELLTSVQRGKTQLEEEALACEALRCENEQLKHSLAVERGELDLERERRRGLLAENRAVRKGAVRLLLWAPWRLREQERERE